MIAASFCLQFWNIREESEIRNTLHLPSVDHILAIPLTMHFTYFLDPDSDGMQAFSSMHGTGGWLICLPFFLDSIQNILLKYSWLGSGVAEWMSIAKAELLRWWRERDIPRGTENTEKMEMSLWISLDCTTPLWNNAVGREYMGFYILFQPASFQSLWIPVFGVFLF